MPKSPALVFEQLEDPKNLLYCTLIEYKRTKFLVVIENVVDDEIQAYVLDSLAAENVDQEWFLHIATKWFYSSSHKYPLSFEFAKMGHGDIVRKILKTFNVNSVSRVIGKLFVYNMNSKPKVKRRKAVHVQETAEIKFKDVSK